MTDYFMLGIFNDDHYEIRVSKSDCSPIAYNREDFKREYDSLASRIGADNIKVFQEVHVFSKTVCSFPDECKAGKWED